MISPESIDLLALPSVQLSDKRSLPHCPAIYFVLDGEEIVYIGQTNSLLLRWQAHHKLKECKALENPRIAWIEISDTTLVLDIEAALIEWFKPMMMKLGRPSAMHRSASNQSLDSGWSSPVPLPAIDVPVQGNPIV